MGNTYIDTNNGANAFYVTRYGSVQNESASFVIDDGALTINSIQDEQYGSFRINSTHDGVGTATRFYIDNDGDISFYEDTGTSPKFVWSSSAESLDISGAGGLTVDAGVQITSNVGFNAALGGRLFKMGTHGLVLQGVTGSTNNFAVTTPSGQLLITNPVGTNDVALIPSASGNVGIGTSSPDTLLHLSGDATAIIRLENSNAGLSLNSVIGGIEFEKQDGSGAGAGVAGSVKLISSSDNGAESSLVFSTSSTARGNNDEAMRIDGSGNVGIGTSSPDTLLHIVASAVAEMRYGAIGPSSNSALRISRNDSTTASGNPLGYLEFGGNDATGAVDTSFAYVGAEASGTHAAGDNPTDLVFGTTADGSATVTERARLTSDGSLLVGGISKTSIPSLNNGVYLQSQTNGDVLGYSLYSNEGTNNRRVAFFLDDTNGVYGFDSSAASGIPEFVIRRASSEQMRLTSTGLGIGTSSPAALLEINKDSEGEYLRVGGDNASNARSLRFTSSTSSTGSNGALHTIKANSTGGEIAFANGNGNIMYLDSSGNVGIGTSSPTTALDARGGVNSAHATFTGQASRGLVISTANTLSNDDGVVYNAQTAGSGKHIFQTGGTERMRIDSSGRVGIGTSSPAQAKLDILLESDYSSHTGHGLSILSNATDAYTSLYIGTDDTIDSAYIQSAGKNTSFTSKKLLLNPNGGNVGIGTSSPQTIHGGASLDGETSTGFEFIAGNSTVANVGGEFLGGYAFRNNDSSGTPDHYSGIRAVASDSFGSANLEFYAGRDSYEAGTSPHMTIRGDTNDALNGFVGIGTSLPASSLDIRSANTAVQSRGNLYVTTTSTAAINEGAQISLGGTYTGTGETFFGAIAARKENATVGDFNAYLQFSVRNTGGMSEKMRIDSGGHVGIGETDPNGYWSQANQLVIEEGNCGITLKSAATGSGRAVST
jgi:hypothetical protein